MRIAFAGNPNSGKTTMYNALTGRNEKVGNWAGVTGVGIACKSNSHGLDSSSYFTIRTVSTVELHILLAVANTWSKGNQRTAHAFHRQTMMASDN